LFTRTVNGSFGGLKVQDFLGRTSAAISHRLRLQVLPSEYVMTVTVC